MYTLKIDPFHFFCVLIAYDKICISFVSYLKHNVCVFFALLHTVFIMFLSISDMVSWVRSCT